MVLREVGDEDAEQDEAGGWWSFELAWGELRGEGGGGGCAYRERVKFR